jgi:hypothetical protein
MHEASKPRRTWVALVSLRFIHADVSTRMTVWCSQLCFGLAASSPEQIKHPRLAALSSQMDVPRYTSPTVSPYHPHPRRLNETVIVNLPPTPPRSWQLKSVAHIKFRFQDVFTGPPMHRSMPKPCFHPLHCLFLAPHTPTMDDGIELNFAPVSGGVAVRRPAAPKGGRWTDRYVRDAHVFLCHGAGFHSREQCEGQASCEAHCQAADSEPACSCTSSTTGCPPTCSSACDRSSSSAGHASAQRRPQGQGQGG